MNHAVPSEYNSRRSLSADNNPFAQQRLERLLFHFPDNRTWETHLHDLHRLEYRAAIVGPRGSGKSTLLREMHRRLSGSCQAKTESDGGGFWLEPISEPLRASLSANNVSRPQTLLIDIPPLRSAGNDFGLSDRQRRQWLRARFKHITSQTLVLIDGIERLSWSQRFGLLRRTAHPKRCGGVVVALHEQRRWTRLPVWLRTRPTVELLETLLIELEIAGTISPAVVRQLFEKHAGDLREVLRELFDRSSSCVQLASPPRS